MLPVTGVGSLPHADAGAAAEFVAATTDVPYLPQLPLRHEAEGLVAQWSGADLESFGGAAALLAALPPDRRRLKTQATGPVTLAMAARIAGRPPAGLWDEVVAGLVGRIDAHLAWIESYLPDAEPVVFLDEPALAGLPPARSTADAYAALGAVLDAVDAPAGIHCCGDVDWTRAAALRPDWISLDVTAPGPAFADSAPALAEAVGAGTRILWGVVPVTAPPLPAVDDLAGRYRRAEGMLAMYGAPLRDLDEASWMSAACGLAGVGVSQAEQVAAAVRAVAGAVRVAG